MGNTSASTDSSTLDERELLDLLSESPVVQRFAYRMVKRAIDLLTATSGLLVLSPLVLVVGLLVKLTSPDPILYPWNVIGRGGRPFRGYKFRTMVKNADEVKIQLIDQNEMNSPVFKMVGDPRITPIGRILRKYSIDELPQLGSVLKGDMSLVGPRPAGLTEWENYQPWQRRKRNGSLCE